ncbi:hypothetical protein [Streptomyces sp. NBC_00342]|uniref:hypothetical protein n=1 Tax=Streptomyces sp. NBC_00342 TaxID=2975718 RepID=UPI002E2A97E5|nr:hypothetical protein [Streptomyces sp. NBC_00342]
MPEFYPSIGEAAGTAMQHNIRLAHSSETSDSDKPLQVRHLPHPSSDPYSVPGMIARLTETAEPNEVAEIVEEINGALVGALPQLTELVAAADWTRVRLSFDDPNHNPAFETWTRLAAAHGMLLDVQEQLEVAEDGIAACPAELTAPQAPRDGQRPADQGAAQRCLRRWSGRPGPADRRWHCGNESAARCLYLLTEGCHPAHDVTGRLYRRCAEHSAAPSPSHSIAPTAESLPEQELPR